MNVFFFFSSRRRHTRFDCDWSSDVCSSDLLLDTLRDLVHIESGSKDMEGVEQIANYVAGKLREQGGKVEILQPTDVYRLGDTPEKIGPMVHAEFKGKGTSRIMLIAHKIGRAHV